MISDEDRKIKQRDYMREKLADPEFRAEFNKRQKARKKERYWSEPEYREFLLETKRGWLSRVKSDPQKYLMYLEREMARAISRYEEQLLKVTNES